MRIPQMIPLNGRVRSVTVPRVGYRWSGAVEVSLNGADAVLLMAGAVAQWLRPGDDVILRVLSDPKPVDGRLVLERDDYELRRVWGGAGLAPMVEGVQAAEEGPPREGRGLRVQDPGERGFEREGLFAYLVTKVILKTMERFKYLGNYSYLLMGDGAIV